MHVRYSFIHGMSGFLKKKKELPYFRLIRRRLEQARAVLTTIQARENVQSRSKPEGLYCWQIIRVSSMKTNMAVICRSYFDQHFKTLCPTSIQLNILGLYIGVTRDI
jgi:hypothetical protein